MNFLFVVWENTANVCYNLMNGINRHTNHYARMVEKKESFIKYPTDLRIDDMKTTSELEKLASNADVIHFSGGNEKYYYPNFKFNIKGKKIVQHFHGTDVRLTADKYATKGRLTFVSTPDLLFYVPKGIPAYHLPNPTPTKEKEYLPVERNNKPLVLFHSPTATGMTIERYISLTKSDNPYCKTSDVNYTLKHTNFLTETIKGMNIQSKILHNLPHAEVLNAKRHADILFDQIFLGWYGVNLIESMSMEIASLVRIDEKLVNHLNSLSKISCPIINVEETTTKTKIQELIDDRKLLKNVQKQSRKWCEDVHSVKAVTKRYIKKIEEVL